MGSMCFVKHPKILNVPVQRFQNNILKQLRCGIQDSGVLLRRPAKMRKTRGNLFLPALQFSCLRSCECQPACVYVYECGCACIHASRVGNRGENQRNNILLLKRLFEWHKPSVVLFCIHLACLTAKNTNIVRRMRHKRKKVHKLRAGSESTQLTAAISWVNSHWFITRCKLVGLDTFSVVRDAHSLSRSMFVMRKAAFISHLSFHTRMDVISAG